jgi:hypothetical protein
VEWEWDGAGAGVCDAGEGGFGELVSGVGFLDGGELWGYLRDR